MKLLRYKLYRRYREDLWFEFLLKRKSSSLLLLAEMLDKKRLFLRKRELISSILPISEYSKKRSKFPSLYKRQLFDKQKLQLFYGLLKDYQLKNLLEKGLKLRGYLGENLLLLLETRISTLLVRAGFAETSMQARQFVGHFGVSVNGVRSNRYNQQLKPGDLLTTQVEYSSSRVPVLPVGYPSSYLEVCYQTNSLLLHSSPPLKQIPLPFKINLSDLISFYY